MYGYWLYKCYYRRLIQTHLELVEVEPLLRLVFRQVVVEVASREAE